jgi:hypothetical protein
MQAKAESALAGSSASTAQLPSLTAEVPTLTSISPGTQSDKAAAVATQSSLAGKPAAIPAWLATSNAPSRVAADSPGKSAAVAQPESSSRGSQAANSAQNPKQKAASALGGSPVAPAAAGSAPQANVPAQSTAEPAQAAVQPASSLPPDSVAVAAPTAPLFDSFNSNSQHAADRQAPTDSFSPTVIQTSAVEREVSTAHGLPPAGLNEAATSAAGAEVHAPNNATGSPDARSSPQYDLDVSASSVTQAASERSSPQPGVATQTGEAHPAIPAGSIGSAEGTDKASDLVGHAAGSATASSLDPDSRSSTAGQGLASTSQVAIKGGIPAPPVETALNPSTNPSAPAHVARESEPLDTASLAPSTGPQSVTASDAAQSSSTMRSQAEQSPESSSPARTLTQPRPAGQGGEAVATPIAADGLGQTSALQSAAILQPAQVAPTPPVLGKADISTAVGAQSGIRSQRSARAVSSVSQANSPANGQIAGQSTDSNLQMRDFASASAPTSMAGSAATGSTGAATSPSAHETFAALDGGTATASPAWTHTGTQYAEAGFHDPALGWVGVRADSASGGVHASLVPDSTDAAQALGGHVAGLNTYLAEQHTPVETLTVAAPEHRSIGSSTDQSGSQGMHQGAGQDSGQGSYSPASSHVRQRTQAVTEAASSIESAPAGRQAASAAEVGSGGRHISVMA